MPTIICRGGEGRREARREEKESREKLTRSTIIETPIVRIFSAVDYGNVLARNSRIITEKCSARASSRHVRQCNTPSIERQYEAAYLSLFLLLSRVHFYERIHQPDYRWSLYCAYGISLPPPASPASLSHALYILPTVFSYPIHPTPFSLHGRQGFLPRCGKSRDARFGSKSKSLSTVPNIFTLDVVSAIPGRHIGYAHFARRCRNRPARCSCQTEYAGLQTDFFFCKLYRHSASLATFFAVGKRGKS